MDIVDLIARLDGFERLGAVLRMGMPSHRFAVDRNAGFSGQQIEQMLKSYGIKIWDRGFTHDTLKFRVKRKQAGWAEYLLFRSGIPVRSKLFYQRNATYQPVRSQRARRGQKRQKRGVFAEMAELFSD